MLGIGFLAFAWNFVSSLRKGEKATSDPWDGRTLEWSIASPPPIYNFATIPTVHGRDAFWAQKYLETPGHQPRGVPSGGADGDGDGAHGQGAGHLGVHMPGLSYFPIIVALGLALAAVGLLTHVAVIALGVLIMLFGIYGWTFEPAEPDE